ncbi:flagellar filament capping protein FliD [Ureibacillus chungkukjangi]|uniref:flagellar filament capping protein FliD n=1 Tax=Ureibacillus chungkukjangi TaxID=1202712 RepID=UPI00384ACDAC
MSTMRIGGLASGMDIDSLVEKLMQAERAPLDKLEQKKQTYEWQRDAYREVNTKLQALDTYIADNLILKSLNTKTATTSNSQYVTASATGSAVGTLSIEGVSKLATAARSVGTQVNGTSVSKLSEIGISGNGSFELKAIKKDGTMATQVTKIEYDSNMTISDFISKINNSGAEVNALFENGRLSISAKNTGDNKAGAEVQLSNDAQNVFGKLGLANNGDLASGGTNAIFQVNGIATERSTNTFTISGYSITLKDIFNSERTTAEKYNAAYTEWKNTNVDNLDYQQKIDDALVERDTAVSNYNTANDDYTIARDGLFGTIAISDTDKANFNKINNLQLVRDLTDSDLTIIQNSVLSNDSEYQAWLNDGSNLDFKAKLKVENISFEQFNAIKSLDSAKLESLSTQAIYDNLGKAFLNSLSQDEKSLLNNVNGSISEDEFNLQIDNWKNSSNETEKALGEKLVALTTIQKSNLRQLSSTELNEMSDVATKYIDSNAKLAIKNTKEDEYNTLIQRREKAEADFIEAYKQQNNGVETGYENATAISESDMPINSGNSITLTSTTNVEEIMLKIKEFVNTYNGLIQNLNDLTKESKYRDYQPLTTAQRKDMEEKEIELWENKSKSGLLRGDSIIQNGLSSMRSLIYQSNPSISNSKFNTLYNVGITTSKNYNSGGTLEIDENKLRKALEEDPDSVTKLFTFSEGKEKDTVVVDGVSKEVDTRGFLEKLRGEMTKIKVKIEGRAGRSTMTETQYTLGKYLKNVNNNIETWQDKLVSIEDRYWRQFTAMETMINKANNQSAMLMGQFS